MQTVNGVEIAWLLSCSLGILVTTWLLMDAIAERHAYIKSGGNGRIKARKLVLDGTVRRDSLRLVVQTMLLAVAFPSLLVMNEVVLSLASLIETLQTVSILALMAVPVLLLTSSLFDAKDRQTLKVVSEQIVLSERQLTDASIISAIEEVGEKADRAYHEANSVNEKLAKLNTQLVKQGDRAEAEIARTDVHQEVQDGRIEAVEDSA